MITNAITIKQEGFLTERFVGGPGSFGDFARWLSLG